MKEQTFVQSNHPIPSPLPLSLVHTGRDLRVNLLPNPMMLLASCVNTLISNNVFHCLRGEVCEHFCVLCEQGLRQDLPSGLHVAFPGEHTLVMHDSWEYP